MAVTNPISGIELPQISLNAALGVGQGTPAFFSRVRKNVSMAVQLTGGPATCRVVLRGTVDGISFSNPIAIFDITTGNTSGDIVTAQELAVVGARADVTALTGGAAPTVTATINAN